MHLLLAEQFSSIVKSQEVKVENLLTEARLHCSQDSAICDRAANEVLRVFDTTLSDVRSNSFLREDDRRGFYHRLCRLVHNDVDKILADKTEHIEFCKDHGHPQPKKKRKR